MANIDIDAKGCSVTARGNKWVSVTLEDVDIDELCSQADLVTKASYDQLKDDLEDQIAELEGRIDALENRLIDNND
jgi:chaperonin cofactor prefoldin